MLCHNVALATYFYVISEDSTRFLPAAAHAGHQLQVPAGDFSLICTLSSTPVQRNQSSIVNAAFRLAAVKKSTRVRHPGGVWALYKQLFPPKSSI